MTDIPEQTSASTAVEAAKSGRGRAGAAADRASEMAGEAFDKAGDMLHDAGDKLQDAAGRAGEVLSEAAGRAKEELTEAATAAITRIRNNATIPAERGTTTIANEVVEKIAGIAAREVPGVYDLGGDTARVLTAVRERLHLGDESKAQGVSVKLQGKEADLSITLVLEYGFVVSSVTDKVREKAISAVEHLLGLDVTNVDILVDDIHVDNDGPVGDDATRAAGY
ncbi:MAG TPA: Asp23/Gls24 family envelope stress response protein, partial [Micromonosporaceae bacterium]|nr:Asp23/Gls24 family envelope stress response protein [Micromonosporaceae bacterium]